MSLLDNVNGLKQTKSYVKLLEGYRESLKMYQNKLERLNKTLVPENIENDHMAAVQVALDLTYIKEELDEIELGQERLDKEIHILKDLFEGMEAGQQEVAVQIGQIDKTIIEPIKKNYTANRFSMISKMDEVIGITKSENKVLKIALVFSLILNLASVGGLAFIILYILGIIAF